MYRNVRAQATLTTLLLLCFLLLPSILERVRAATVTYDFNSDTAGSAPANTTTTVGTFQVTNQAVLGNSLRATAQVSNVAGIMLNNIASSTDYYVTWKEAYQSGGGKSGFILRAQSGETNLGGIRQGYYFQIGNPSSSAPNTAIIWRFDAGNFNNTLMSKTLTSASPRWFRAMVIGNSLGFYYSDDGVSFTLIGSTTDSTYSSGKVQYTAGYGSAVGNDYVDDIVYTPYIDSVPPAVSAVASSTSATSAIVTWTTDELSDSQVEYGASSSYTASTTLSSALTTSHSVLVTGLSANTTYHFRVRSNDASGNLGVSDDNTLKTVISGSVPAPLFLLPFDGDYTDTSGNGNNGVNSSGTIAADGTRGQVLSVVSGSHVQVNKALPSSFTKAAWVRLNTSTAGSYNIMSCGPISSGNTEDFFWVSNSTAGGAPSTMTLKAGSFPNSASSANYVWDTTLFPSNTWVQVGLTFDGATKAYNLYKNGLLVATGTAAVAPVNNLGETIGSCGSLVGWNGYIDDAELWDTALTPAQMISLYAGDVGTTPMSPSAPTGLVARSSSGSPTSITLSWAVPNARGSAITDYVVEYKRSSDSAWSTFADGVSVATTSTVTDLSAGTAYDFRVSAVNAIGTGSPSATASGTPGATLTDYYILSTGQSLSLGAQATPAISLSQPYNNLMFNPGVEGTLTPLIALTESGNGDNGNVETPSSGIANSLSGYTSSAHPFIVGLHGHNGTAYSGLKKGTTYFTKGITQITNAKSYLNGINTVLAPIGITLVHGEADYQAGLASTYEANLHEWQTDYQSDVHALTGGTSTLPLFISQMNSGWTGEVAVAQLNAHRDYPGQIILIGPKYQYGYYTDHVHLTNTQSRWSGEMFAKVMNKVIFQHQTWNPLMPTSVERKDNIVLISYDIPVGTLAIDTTNVAQRPADGFEFTQTGGNSVSISSVELVNGNTQVKLTLSAAPTGTSQRIRYAWSCPQGGTTWCGNSANANYVGGNIRDTDNSVSPASDGTGLPLYDWGVTFDEPLAVDTSAPVVSVSLPSGTLSLGTTNTTLSVTTDEPATCKYATSAGTPFDSMANSFTTTGGVSHTTSLTGLSDGTHYTYYVRCEDGFGNATTDDLTISFSVASKTSVLGSGSTGGGWTPPVPTPPAGGFTADVSSSTYAGIQTLHLNFGEDVSKVVISENSTFAPASYFDATSTLDLPASSVGVWYIKFCNVYTKCSDPVVVSSLGGTSSPVPAKYSFTVDLSLGMQGDAVRRLQQQLAADPSLYPEALITGLYGPLTQAAVERFQVKYGIVTDGTAKTTGYGTVGPQTRAKLNELLGGDTSTSTPVLSANYSFSEDLSLHDTGEAVRQLQVYLNAHGFQIAQSGPGSSGNETNYFGSSTYAALVRFQNAHASDILAPAGLTSGNGYFGPGTRKYINTH